MDACFESYWQKRFHSAVSILEAIDLMKKGVSQSQVAVRYGVSRSVLDDWKRKFCEKKYLPSVDKICGPPVDEPLFDWYLSLMKEGKYVTLKMIQLKAKEIHLKMSGTDDFSPGLGWVSKWKKRHGIVSERGRKSLKQLPTTLHLSTQNKIHEYLPPNHCHNSKPPVAEKLPVPQASIEPSFTFEENHISSSVKDVALGRCIQNKITEQELEDDDEIVKELDSMLSGFQHKIINKENDEDCYKRIRNNDDILEPKTKVLVTEKQVAKTLLEHTFPAILKDICPDSNQQNNAEMVREHEKPNDGVSNNVEPDESDDSSEETIQTDNEEDISDEEEHAYDDATSEISSLTSSVESFDEKDEEEYITKRDNTNTTRNMTEEENDTSTEYTLTPSEGSNETQNESGMVKSYNKEKVGTKDSKSDKFVLEKDSKSDDNQNNEEIKNAKEEKIGVVISAVSGFEESNVIVLNSSSEEDSEDEDITNNENEESDDDVIFIENKSETIVIDTSDGEEVEEEKS